MAADWVDVMAVLWVVARAVHWAVLWAVSRVEPRAVLWAVLWGALWAVQRDGVCSQISPHHLPVEWADRWAARLVHRMADGKAAV